MLVSLSQLPDAKKEYVLDFPSLSGGLNLEDLSYRLNANESPDMNNLCWRDGVLSCRDGQSYTIEPSGATGHACFSETFWGHAFFHIGANIVSADLSSEEPVFMELYAGVPEVRGTFFRYSDALYYKTEGAYVRIEYDVVDDSFSAFDMTAEAYTPIILINAAPADGAGDSYQSENRISPKKTVWYSAENDETDAPAVNYYLPVKDANTAIVSISAIMAAGDNYTDLTETTAELTGDPEEWGVDWDGDFAFWPGTGHILFKSGPHVSTPSTNNTVHVTYSLENPDAMASVMGCPHAIVYGGDQNVCVVVGGCEAQPNAYFWNGNHIVMDAGYFPMEHYNLAGDTQERVTGFGKQQSTLVVFKEHSIGRADFSTSTVSSREYIEMPYTAINSRIGCDLPWTIQLIENNLVFCNSRRGVFFIRDSSAAYENNVVCISGNINGSAIRKGLLSDIGAVSKDVVVSVDDDNRYWVVANGKAYVWDYLISPYAEPSWFRFTNIRAVSFCMEHQTLYHLDAAGGLTVFSRQFSDYGEAIEKKYVFATQNFGTHDRLKDVRGVTISVRSDTYSDMILTYVTDTQRRVDQTPISSYIWSLYPRNLAFRFLGVPQFAAVARRMPMCRRIKHFTMELTNSELGQDMSIVSAQVYYVYAGRYR